MSVADVKKNAQDKMIKSIETLKADLAKVRTGRAHTGILDHVMVDYYGSPTALTQVANLTLIDARTIGVQPYEKKMLSTIEKAIRDSDLGLNPSTFGEMIRVPTPAADRRAPQGNGQAGQVAKPKTPRSPCATSAATPTKQLKKLVKDKAISEDDERRAQDEIQKLTDKAVVDIDKLVAEKEKEIMTV
jgi:ribosome recycling factor